MEVDLAIGGVGQIHEQELTHEDADPWKGLLTVNVTNTGTEAWGDFHFQIFQVPGYPGNVVFDVSAPNQPTGSQNALQWNLSADSKSLDLFFYGDPVFSGESATFTVFTDNTTNQVPFFGVLVYPTPVPVPGALLLLGTGIAGLAAIRKKGERSPDPCSTCASGLLSR